ncbi:MAG: hypothetical protein MRY72_06090 [Aquisalinus sp.]|nr:hypothetical protein [Aquisalinus sp.]
MSAYIQSLDNMFAVWNTHSESEQKTLISAALEHNLHFVDPRHNIMGHDAFLKMVRKTQEEVPGAEYSRSSEVGFQNNFCRYHWWIHIEKKLVMTGFDTVEVNDSGKISKVIGFFGELKRDQTQEDLPA